MRSHEWGVHPIRRRYMDPSTGRFTTLDSFAGDMQDPLSLNKYLYTQADPVNGYDPTGQDDFSLDVGSPAVGALADGATARGGLMGWRWWDLEVLRDAHEFEVDGYTAKIEWAEGWEGGVPWTRLGSGAFGSPWYDQNGNSHVGPTYVSTSVNIWGHDSCNTIGSSLVSDYAGLMYAYVNLSPGKYLITWGYRVEASAKAAPGGGFYTISSPGHKDITDKFGPTKPVKVQDMLSTVVNVTEDGWFRFATYRPQINISGPLDSDPKTYTSIEGTLYIYEIRKIL
jgi:RHS repeat-associated protein